MRVLVGVAGGVLVVLMLLEIFFTFLLPRRVKRDPRIVRWVFAYGWRPWRRVARALPAQPGDTLLGIYGPFGVLFNLVLWVSGMMLGYACLEWAAGSRLGAMGRAVDFGQDLYFSAATMTTDGPAGLAAHSTFTRALQVVDAASGLAVLAIVIGYLPALYQAFSRREATVSQLDARAGSPPSAGRLLVRTTAHGGWAGLSEYLGGWEQWVAELMETHLAYPVLGYFRSQHLNQNWLAALTTVLDSCAFAIAAAPREHVDSARFTFAIARHAVVDLSYSFHVPPNEPLEDRLPPESLGELLAQLRAGGLEPAVEEATVAERLRHTRAMYEGYVCALSQRLALALPAWLAPDSPNDNWRNTEWH
ncbi:MAG TPA: hypothetical protein VGY13_14710 [Solirubrobacteraceae bacterium]|jgi:hypothetical protein|nr:hypothetical protein [Solirubrobacteraceae bacterium]